jgi:hypothetical protein
MIASAVSFAVSAVVALIVAPRPDEVLDVVNAWNRGHRDEQVALAWASSIQQVVPPNEPTEQER